MFKKIIFLLFIIFAPSAVNATSGACSSHGGVNCSMGRQGDGKVFCNDGWTGSMVQYEYTEMCDNDPYARCIFPSSGECLSVETYQDFLERAISGMAKCVVEGGRTSGFNRQNSAFCDLETDDERENYMLEHDTTWRLKSCKDSVELYEKSMIRYNDCIKEVDEKQENYMKEYLELLEKSIETEKTIDYNYECRKRYGEYSHFDFSAGSGCLCDSGYEWNNNEDVCIKEVSEFSLCKLYVIDSLNWYKMGGNIYYDNSCRVLRDYDFEETVRNAHGEKCHEYTFNKLLVYNIKIGNLEVYLHNLDDKCYSSEIKQNTLNEFIDKEKKFVNSIDSNLTDRLRGKILLQVEEQGQAWYVNLKTGDKHYMADGNDAYNIMRDLGVGITDNDLNKIKGDKEFAKNHGGKIFLQVEDLGQAFYVDFRGVAHYLKDGNSAYNIMRELGLGISNLDIRKIVVF